MSAAEKLGSRPGAPTLEPVAPGAWLLRMVPPMRTLRLSNVYLLEDEDGVTLFDSGSRGSEPWLQAAAERFGGIRRVLLSHAHADHRGGAAGLDAPVLCHPEEVADAEGDGGAHYFEYSKIGNPVVRAMTPSGLRRMDGGPVKVDATVADGDEVAADFRVKHLPGHAPGLIGLWRESDRTAIVSDAVFVFNPFSLLALSGEVRLPPAPVRPQPDQARASMRRVAELDPASVWLGHYGPLREDAAAAISKAAEQP